MGRGAEQRNGELGEVEKGQKRLQEDVLLFL
jgi:hypothetical protein